MITNETVAKMAHLSRLTIAEDEMDYMCEQLNKTLAYVEQLQEIDTEGLEPTAYVVPEHDALRDDVVVPSLSVEKVLENGPTVTKGHFAIPKVIG